MSKTSTHSSYWMDDNIWDDTDELGIDTDVQPEEANLARIARLSAARRATANFVNILTGRNDIPVQFSSGKNSYTTGEVVVISADDNPEHFDSMVGLALHEGSHILLSDFKFLHALKDVKDRLTNYHQLDHTWNGIDLRNHGITTTVMQSVLHPALAKTLPTLSLNVTNLGGLDYFAPEGSSMSALELMSQYRSLVNRYLHDLQIIMNIIEDRRIDKFVYQNCGGYRPYYDALYARYFFTDEVRKNLKWNPEWRKVTVDNYINHLLFVIHPDFNPNALPGLKHLVKMIDLPNINRVAPKNGELWQKNVAFDEMPELWKVANRIYAYILRFATLGNDPDNFNGFDNMPEGFQDSVQDSTSMLPNLDLGPEGMQQRGVDSPDTNKNGTPKKISYNAKKGKTALDKAKQVVNGEVKKKRVTKAEQNAVDALESANADMVDLKGDGIPGGQCMVTRKMSEKLFGQDWFIFGNRWSENYTNDRRIKSLAAGKRMGQILAHKLQVRNDPVVTKNTRLLQGGLDRRLLANLGMDITSVFQKTRVDTFKPAMLHLTLDGSGSMNGRKWDKVMTVATALAYVGTKTRSVDVVITIRGGNEMPIVCVVFDSRRDQFTSWVKWAKRLEPNGMTPEGLCFKATMELITECSATHDVYFINFSDGEPGFTLDTRATNVRGKKQGRRSYWGSENNCHYSGELATKHTRQMVQYMTERGVKVLSYFISEAGSYGANYSMKTFRKMYGEDAVAVNVESAGEVLRTLNKRLTARV